jgi:ketosteroid isomerase-like protein
MSNLEKSVERLIDQYKSAVKARDVGKFIRLYDPKARIFDAWGVWEYEDSTKWQIAIEGWFSSDAGADFRVTFENIQISGSEEQALVSAIVTYASSSSGGEPILSMQNRITWVLGTSSHVLRIVHEHTSAPIGFEDQKAILQRAVTR